MIWLGLFILLEALPFITARCGEPPKLTNTTLGKIDYPAGNPVYGKYREGTVAYYYPCELGNGSKIRSVCQANGEWTHSSCEATCPFLRLDRTEVVYNKKYFTFEFGGVNTLFLVLVPQTFDYRYEVNTLVSFICYQGYYREGSGSAICQSSGNWSEETPKCVAAKVSCPKLRLENGKVDYNTSYFTIEYDILYRVNTSASFSCDEYYHIEGSSSAICQSSGNWSEETPICAATPCLKPTVDIVENGYFNITHVYPAPNDTFVNKYTFLLFGCDPGYTFSNHSELHLIYCTPNGTWSGPIPSCILQEV